MQLAGNRLPMLDDESKKDLLEAFEDLHIEVEACLVDALNGVEASGQGALLNRLFRAIHNVKGNAGLMGVQPVVDFAHVIEEVAESLRSNKFDLSEKVAEALLIAMDRLRDIHEQELLDKRFDNLCIEELKALYHALAIADKDAACAVAQQTLQFLGAGVADEHASLSASPIVSNDQHILQLGPCADSDLQARDLAFFQHTALALDNLEPSWFGRSIQLYDWAMKMNEISGRQVDETQFAAAIYLHDLGMSFVPAEIAGNRLYANPQSHDAVRNHPDWGYQYLVRMPGWEEAATIIREHHECVDGTGYPSGLKGGDIHPGAKILKILDSFFALTNGCVDVGRRSSTVRAVSAINARIDTEFEGLWVQCFNHMIRKELRLGNI